MLSVNPTSHRIVFDAPNSNTNSSSNLSHITKPENWSGLDSTTSPPEVTRKKGNSRRTCPSSSTTTTESMETSEGPATTDSDDASTLPSGPKSPRRCDDGERPVPEEAMTSDEQPSSSSSSSSRPLNNVNKDDSSKDNLTQRVDRNFVDAVVPRRHDDAEEEDDNDGLIAEESIELIESSGVININGGEAGPAVDPIVRAVKCQINVRKNGEMEVIVPGDEEMSRKLQELLRLRLRQMLPQTTATTTTTPTPPLIPPACPLLKLANLNTIAELEALEGQLKDPAILKRMKENIKRTSGKTGPDAMRRNLRNLMSDSLANEFRWAGREGKRNFKDLTLAKILMDSVRESHATATVLHLENAIKSWLKQAPHRLQNSSKP